MLPLCGKPSTAPLPSYHLSNERNPALDKDYKPAIQDLMAAEVFSGAGWVAHSFRELGERASRS